MGEIRNTSKAMREDPAEALLALAVGMSTGSASSFIEDQERQGQSQLVNSDRLPSDIRDREAFEALGFTFDKPDADDPMFMPATLPAGWKREGSDHAMWSYIVDELGRQRVAIFYKAAFYDRSAFARLVGLDSYVTNWVEYDGPAVIFDDKWATRDAVRTAVAEAAGGCLKQAADFRRYAQEPGRDDTNRQWCGEHAADYDARAAKYDAAMRALDGTP